MTGIKNFVLGFTLSLCSIALYEQLRLPVTPKSSAISARTVNLSLYKKASTSTHLVQTANLFAPVKKQSLASVNTQKFTAQVSDGLEDDEILSINIDGNIPIDFSFSDGNTNQSEVLQSDNEEKSAMLPTDLTEEEKNQINSPWVVAKGSPSMKNKKLLDELNQSSDGNLFTDKLAINSNTQDNLSFKVAEKIKQSIIFPIPDEILNDENLTPTFISSAQKKENKAKTSPKPQKTVQKVKDVTPQENLQITKQQSPATATPQGDGKSILDSISSWFSDKPDVAADVEKPVSQPKKKSTPAYSSHGQQQAPKVYKQNSSEDLANFYESLQKVKKDHVERKIIPEELKLSFQPGRAEISGTTLKWLKAFSEATINNTTRLQIYLDASATPELQKKRLNLLYTIFMNNGVDFQKVDTLFSLTEPDTFIIRTAKDQ